VTERIVEEPQPPATVYEPLAAELASTRMLPEAKRWLEDELERAADPADTHPSFAERLESLGLPRDTAFSDGAGGESAAQRFLGDAEPRIRERLDEDWRRSVSDDWQAGHREARQAMKTLEELDARAASEQLSIDDVRTLAELTHAFRDADQALQRYEELLAAVPGDAVAQFAVGRILLERGDDDGLRRLDAAMEADPDAILPASEIAFEYLKERGRGDEAERYRVRAERHADVLDAAAEERQPVSEGDELEPATLPDDLLDRVRAALARHEEVGAAYLARKRLEHLDDEHPLYVVGLIPRHRWRQLWKDADDDEPGLAERVVEELDLPFDVHVIVPGPRNPLAQKLPQVATEIYSSR
jgi:hypothetical protein